MECNKTQVTHLYIGEIIKPACLLNESWESCTSLYLSVCCSTVPHAAMWHLPGQGGEYELLPSCR